MLAEQLIDCRAMARNPSAETLHWRGDHARSFDAGECDNLLTSVPEGKRHAAEALAGRGVFCGAYLQQPSMTNEYLKIRTARASRAGAGRRD